MILLDAEEVKPSYATAVRHSKSIYTVWYRRTYCATSTSEAGTKSEGRCVEHSGNRPEHVVQSMRATCMLVQVCIVTSAHISVLNGRGWGGGGKG